MKIYRTPTGLVTGHSDFWTIGWKVSNLEPILPKVDSADMTVDAQNLPQDSIVGLEVSVVGDCAKNRQSIVGFPIVAVHQFGSSLRVEILAFTLTEQQWEPKRDS